MKLATEGTKLRQLQEFMLADDWEGAMRLAAKFPRLGDEAAPITRAHQARLRPEFYRQLGQDPAALWAEGVAALKRRYGEPCRG